jgi:methionyl-tRNA formyltransferase|tara:strand:- start:671 stop:1618 length:948 start_codon:yes stop_codon:yes gene_type:complete
MKKKLQIKRVALVSRVTWGVEALRTMLESSSRINICGVFTLPEEESRRHSNYASFADICYLNNLQLIETKNINNNIGTIKDMNLDYLFVLGWSQIISKEIINVPAKGCIGNHPTLLPRDRGRAPVSWQLIKGYRKSALTFFFIDEGVDSGDVIMQRPIILTLEDTAMSFYRKIIDTGKKMLNEIIPLLIEDRVPRKPQNHRFATYLSQRRPEDGVIDWSISSFALYNLIRGLTMPFPGAFTFFQGRKLYVWSAKVDSYVDLEDAPGFVIGIEEDGILVSTGKGAILLTSVQFEGETEIGNFREDKVVSLIGKVLG